MELLCKLLLCGSVVVIFASLVHVASAWMSAARRYLATLADDGLSTELGPLSTAINCPGIF